MNNTVELFRAAASQERIWLAERQDPSGRVYHVWCSFDIRGDLDVAALRAACVDVQDRHEPLRTAFAMVDAQLYQVISPEGAEVLVEYREASADPESALVEMALAPFDLANGPLWRVGVLEMPDPGHWAILIAIHHIVIDGGSLRVLLDDLAVAYRARRNRTAPGWKEPQLQYADYTSWLAEQDHGEEIAWWREQLDDHGRAPVLPLDRLRAAPPSPAADGVRFTLADEVAADLARLAAGLHCPVSTVMLAAWAFLLSHHGDSDDFLIGVPAAGRVRPETRDMMGVFVNTLPVRLRVPGQARFSDLVVGCRNVLSDSYEHQAAPLEDIIAALRPVRDEARMPLFDTLFTAQNTAGLGLNLEGVETQWRHLPIWRTRYDLECNVWDSPQPNGLVVFRTSIFERSTVQALVDSLVQVLKQIARTDLPLTVLRESLPALPAVARGYDAARLERVLLAEPEIVDARAVAVGDSNSPDQRRMVLFVVTRAPLSDKRLRQKLGELSNLVAAVVPVAGLPLTMTGRLSVSDLGALPIVDEETLAGFPQEQEGKPIGWRLVSQTASARPALPWPAKPSPKQEEPVAEASVPKPGAAPSILTGGPPLELPARSLWDALTRLATGAKGITFIDRHGREDRLSYAGLADSARRIAAGLERADFDDRLPLVVAFQENRDFLPVLWAGLFRGNPVLPWNLDAVQVDPIDRLRHIGQTVGDFALVTTAEVRSRFLKAMDRALERAPRTLLIDSLLSQVQSASAPAPDDPMRLALLLLTSGSTKIPKAVQVTHQMILHRSAAYSQASGIGENDVSLNWMPLDHVGGVVMFHLRDVVLGAEQIQAATSWVLADPLRWMELCHRFGVTSTWSPNFAEGLVADEAHRLSPGQWDLSRLRHILNGGEAVLADTVKRFVGAMAEQGLRRDAVRPSWGMSETTSGETDGHLADPLTWTDPVPLGPPVAGFSMRVVDEQGVPVPMGEPGALQVRGVSVTPGYLNNPEINASAFTEDGWFRTGDQAFLADGHLHMIGRDKDEIIVNGVNVTCERVELTVESACRVVRSYTVAVGVKANDSEQLLVAAVPGEDADVNILASDIRRAIQRELGLQAVVALVSREDIPRTGIGKKQRRLLRDRLLSGVITPLTSLGLDFLDGVPNLFHTPRWRHVSRRGGEGISSVLLDADEAVPWVGQLAVPVRMADGESMADVVPDEAAVLRLVPGSFPDTRSAAVAAIALAERVRRRVRLLAQGRSRVVIVAESDPGNLELGSLPGLVRTLDQELGETRLRLIFCGGCPLKEVAAEISASDPETEVWLSGQSRLVRRLEPIVLETNLDSSATLPREGLLVVTGGTGGVATALAPYLLARSGPLALIGRRYPGMVRPWWPSEVLYRSADITDPAALSEVFHELEQTTGTGISAVLHLAGEYHEEDSYDLSASLRPAMWDKVVGAGSLADALAGRDALLIGGSSVSAFLGAPGAAGYASANSFVDALAQSGVVKARSIAWSMWRETGMSRGYAKQERTHERGSTIQDAPTAAAMTALAFADSRPHLLLGLDDRKPWVRAYTWTGDALARQLELIGGCLDDAPVVSDVLGRSVRVASRVDAAMAAPGSEEQPREGIEAVVADTWRQVLGVGHVNRAESFFDLGGSSIQLSRVHGILEEKLGLTIELVELFRHHTVRAMGRYLESGGQEASPREQGVLASGSERGRRRAAARERNGVRR